MNANSIAIPQEQMYVEAFLKIFNQMKAIFFEKVYLFKICLIIFMEFINLNSIYISPVKLKLIIHLIPLIKNSFFSFEHNFSMK